MGGVPVEHLLENDTFKKQIHALQHFRVLSEYKNTQTNVQSRVSFQRNFKDHMLDNVEPGTA